MCDVDACTCTVVHVSIESSVIIVIVLYISPLPTHTHTNIALEMSQLHVTRVKREFREIVTSEEVSACTCIFYIILYIYTVMYYTAEIFAEQNFAQPS